VSVKHALLALLCEGPRYGYELKAAFEARTGDAWPLNVGQVYTTLARLERDGQVERDSEDAEGHVHYRLTDAGRREVQGWWEAGVEREAPPRDELAIKLALALTVPGVDVLGVLQRQRTATVRALQAHTRRRKALTSGDPERVTTAALLVLESLVFAAEAEVRWLDHCEARLTRSTSPRPGAGR
jgi:DNA-binding PadR family transcriptional regulator